MAYAPPEPVLASRAYEDGDEVEFWWVGRAKTRGARVIKTDPQGMRWTLDIESNHLVTQRVAAGLLDVSLMTVNNWVRAGTFGPKQSRNGVSVVPMRRVEELAEERGIFIVR
jgi:hypothetical protein